MSNIFGAYDTRDLQSMSIDDIEGKERRVYEDLKRFGDQYQKNITLLLDSIAYFDTWATKTFGLSTGGELQEYGEYSQGVEATRTEGEWNVAAPISRKGDRQIYTKEYLGDVSLYKLQMDVIAAHVRDTNSMYTGILRAILRKSNYTFTDRGFPGQHLGQLTIRRLANADSAAGEIFVDGTAVQLGSLQHYVGSNSATWANSFFTTLRDKLYAVGLGTDIVCWIAKTNESTVRALTDFVPLSNPNIVDAAAKYARVKSPQAIGRMEDANMEVQVMPFMPAGYIFAYDRAAPKPVVIRQHPKVEHQGFNLIGDDTRAEYDERPLRNKHWERIAGMAVDNRVNGVCMQVVASTTYTDPSL